MALNLIELVLLYGSQAALSEDLARFFPEVPLVWDNLIVMNGDAHYCDCMQTVAPTMELSPELAQLHEMLLHQPLHAANEREMIGTRVLIVRLYGKSHTNQGGCLRVGTIE